MNNSSTKKITKITNRFVTAIITAGGIFMLSMLGEVSRGTLNREWKLVGECFKKFY